MQLDIGKDMANGAEEIRGYSDEFYLSGYVNFFTESSCYNQTFTSPYTTRVIIF